jgi:epoxyqueuosine reductase
MCKDDTPISSNLTLTSENISKLALELGFDACSVAPVRRLDNDAQFMDNWIAQGLHGEMDYLTRNCEKRYDPSRLVPGAQTVVVCLLHFDKSGRDYHRTVKSLLYKLEARLKEEFGEEIVSHTHQHIFCDSAPMLERRWCVEAGLGFIGKNHQLIHPTLGSLVHPGEILINAPVPNANRIIASGVPEKSADFWGALSPIAQLCADCRLCLDACPTGALRNNVWDATQCIAYATHHCLECQNICPFNL